MTDTHQINNSVLIQGATLADLERMIDRAIEKRMEAFYERLQEKRTSLVERKAAARMIGRSLPTLDKYGKVGILHPRHIGGRIYYAQSEIDKHLFNTKKINQL